jgi:creatinine amidohydrolase
MTDEQNRGVQFERLLPWQLRERLAARPVAYLPLGTYEWHCEHLPVGLDALTAHGICVRAAAKDGGIVFPALHYGTGGGHSRYPWTIMMESDREIDGLLRKTLSRLQDFGFKQVVLFSGHFPEQQLAMIDAIASDWPAGGPMSVLATAVNRIEGLAIGPDHAGLFETTLLSALWPDLMQIDRLPSLKDAPLSDEDAWDARRHDPTHPLWGIVGPDPRAFKPAEAPALLDAAVDWLVAAVRRQV